MISTVDTKKGEGLLLVLWFPGLFIIILMSAIIFISAGRINYWQGWGFSASMLLIMGTSIGIFIKDNRIDLIKERAKPGPGTKWWDKIFMAFFIPSYFAIMIVGSLDSGRYLWTTNFPLPLYILGYIIFSLSVAVQFWSIWVNRFFSSVVRIQTEREQVVIQNGPYRFVRHPGYLTGIFLGIGTSLVFGSLWGLIPAGVIALLLIIRTGLEDAMLQRELAGYSDYAKKVKYRLFPGLW